MSEVAGPVSASPFGPVALTPTAFLDRARVVHRDRPALVNGVAGSAGDSPDP